MANLDPLALIPTGDMESISEFLGFLKDPEKYRERLAELETRRKEINTLIDTYGKIENIKKLEAEAFTNSETAEKILKETILVRQAANAELDAERDDARAEIAKLKEAANEALSDREKVLREGEKGLLKRESEWASRDRDMQSREAKAAQLAEAAGIIRDKYVAATTELRAALDQAGRAL
jgi:DNA repair exonuclease SbcCD ATPase subunit